MKSKNIISTTIRLTKAEEIGLLPDVERSAGESFRTLRHLAWVADDVDMSPETHLQYVMSGTSWVAEVNNQVVGFLCAELVMGDLHVWEMAIRQEWQGQGLGRQLMNTAIDYASHNRLQSVTLTTFREVPWNEPFYRSLGFEVIDPESMEPRLAVILHNETQHGFPRELRCAMRLVVLPTQAENLSSW